MPVLLWVITEQCEKTLDHYEGYPSFYIKQNISVEIDNGEDTIEAMFYVMDDKYCQKMQTPTEYYYGGIERGYTSNGMPVEELKTASYTHLRKPHSKCIKYFTEQNKQLLQNGKSEIP